MSSISDKLTAKQRKFADEYIKTGNATQSAIKAGYSEKYANTNANKLLQNTTIKAYIKSHLNSLSSAKIADAQEVLEYLSSVMRGEQKEDVVSSQGLFKDVPVSAKDRISAAKELIKRYPSFDPMEKQKLKKLTADARISEARAKAMEDNGQDIEKMVDKILDVIAEEDGK